MAVLKSKGCSLLLEISAVYTAVPQLQSINVSGEAAENFETTSLNTSGAHKTYASNGLTETAEITADGHYDPSNAVITAWEALVATPANNNVRVTYTDSSPTSKTYVGVSFGIDKTISLADPVGMTLSVKTSGAPS